MFWSRRASIEQVRAQLHVSERRACAALGQHRSTQRKVPRGRDDEQRLTADIIELARQYGRYGDLAIAIAAVLPGKLDNIGCETLLVVTTARDLALCRAMLPERRTGATLGNMQLRSDLLNAGTATRGA